MISRLRPFTLMLVCLTFSATASASTKLTVLLDWFMNPDHAPLVIAQENGYFADAGLEVEMVEPADPSMPRWMMSS